MKKDTPGFPTKRLLAERIRVHREELKSWYCAHATRNPPPFYCSIDLRDSGHKIAPVDSNLYPAGWNNVCPEDQRTSPSIAREELKTIMKSRGLPEAKRVLVIPELHTANGHYVENLYYLTQMLANGGLEVRLGWYDTAVTTPVHLVSITQKELTAYPIRVDNGVLSLNDGSGTFTPDVILLNNDFSSGYPTVLDDVTQPIVPSHQMGWHTRKKSEHFVHFNRLASEFAAIIGIDPWTIQIDTEEVGDVDFSAEKGIEQVATVAEGVLSRMQAAYTAHGVEQKPFAFVKNNAGTYGMGIMVVHTADEVRQMNRRTKNKMSVGKNKLAIHSVVVQEGIPTAMLVDRLPAEPVIYLVGSELIGGFLRTNTEKGSEENLNSQGMVFRKLCMSDLRDVEAGTADEGVTEPVFELVYGWVARISALATGIEIAEHIRNDNRGHQPALIEPQKSAACGG